MIINNIHISDFAQTVLAEFRGNTMSSMAPAPCSLGRSMAPASNQHQPTRNQNTDCASAVPALVRPKKSIAVPPKTAWMCDGDSTIF